MRIESWLNVFTRNKPLSIITNKICKQNSHHSYNSSNVLPPNLHISNWLFLCFFVLQGQDYFGAFVCIENKSKNDDPRVIVLLL